MSNTTIGAIVRGDREVFPPYLYEAYQSTRHRAPTLPLIEIPLTISELTGPGPAISAVTPEDADLTRNAGTGGEAIGQRIIVTGRVLNDLGNPLADTLLEIWQANASGRYLHKRDQWPGPLDPNFLGMGRCLTNGDFGSSMRSRLVTQMYFPDDPLHQIDPILQSVPTPNSRERLIAAYDHTVTEPEWALGYRWDIVLHGPQATPFEPAREGNA